MVRPVVRLVVMVYAIRNLESTARPVPKIVENADPAEMVYAVPKMVRIVYLARKIVVLAPPIAEMRTVMFGVVKVVTVVSTIAGFVVTRMVARSHKIPGALNVIV